jgi:hypothetical protein
MFRKRLTPYRSLTVDHLFKRQEASGKEAIAIAVLYIKFNEPQQTLVNLVGSLVQQLVRDLCSIPAALQELYDRHALHDSRPLLIDVARLLPLVADQFGTFYVVVDDIDECSEDVRSGLLESLRLLPSKLRLLVTSRSLASIRDELADFKQLEITANRADMELFVDHKIRKCSRLLKMVQKSPALRTELKETIARTAEKM